MGLRDRGLPSKGPAPPPYSVRTGLGFCEQPLNQSLPGRDGAQKFRSVDLKGCSVVPLGESPQKSSQGNLLGQSYFCCDIKTSAFGTFFLSTQWSVPETSVTECKPLGNLYAFYCLGNNVCKILNTMKF